MKIAIAVPVRPGVTSGNSVTGDRWQRRLQELGHEVGLISVDQNFAVTGEIPEQAELVIALHARRTANAVEVAKAQNPHRPIIVALAGTDLYQDLPESQEALASLRLASRLVVLQDQGIEQLSAIAPEFGVKASVVHQSVEPSALTRQPDPNYFTVVVLSHLRAVKDPLMAAQASRLVPAESRLRVLHAGSAHSDVWKALAEAEMENNTRYQWLGGLGQEEAARLLAGADLLACTSELEGGANVVSEAIALGLGVVGTEIGGNRGMLGPEHRGLVDVGDDRALGQLFWQLESDRTKLEELTQVSIGRQWMTSPQNERDEWQAALDQLN